MNPRQTGIDLVMLSLKFNLEGGFTELEEFTHILPFFVASIMVLVAAIHMALDKMDLTPSIQSYDRP